MNTMLSKFCVFPLFRFHSFNKELWSVTDFNTLMVSLGLFSSFALALWNRWEVLMRVLDVFWKLEVKTLEISGIINPLFDERTFCSLPAFFHATTGFGKIQRNSINIRSCDRLNHRIWYRYPFVDVQWRWSMFFLFFFFLVGRVF